MIRKMVLIFTLLIFVSPVFAEEINMTPQSTFSGVNNKGIKPAYPKFNIPVMSDTVDTREDFMKPKSVRHMSEFTPSNDKKAPMTYNEFPQNYDSSNSMMLIQGGMNNMFMGY